MFEAAKCQPERHPISGAIDPASVTHIRNQVATMQWLAAKLNPKRYGEKIDMSYGIETEDPLASLIRRISGTGFSIAHDTATKPKIIPRVSNAEED